MRKWLLFIVFLLGSQVLLSAVPENPRYVVVLAGFKDQKFTLEEPASLVRDLFCKQGFNYSGATGSVSDYFKDVSSGRFAPQFDIFGPVTLPGKMQDYGKDVYKQGVRIGDIATEQAILDACQLLDDQVDFSTYDADNDGFVDLVILLYAGYNQAQGGKADALWSQQYSVQCSEDPLLTGARLDGVGLGEYVTASELMGASGAKLTAIGPVCHEMGHFLGLPDFYDTDGAQGGHAGGVYGFSLMDGGLYNNGGHTPPTFNALELNLLGWLPDEALRPLPEDGMVRLPAVMDGGVYVSRTGTPDEFYLYEYRDGKGWDAPLPQGLVIYHVDKNADRMVGEHTAAWLWENWRDYNGLNMLADHPCFYLVPSSHPASLSYDATLSSGRMVFPGLDQVLSYEPASWEGEYLPVQLTNIGLEDGAVHFRVLKDAGANINGRVYDTAGKPLEGVSVALVTGDGDVDALTDADGFFYLKISPDVEPLYSLTVSKQGYASHVEDVSMDGQRMVSVAITLAGEKDALERNLSKYDRDGQMGYYQAVSVLGGVRFGPEELYPYVGQELKEVSFYPYMQPSFEGEVYVVVDLDGERVLTRKVENLHKGPYFKQILDISDAHILIPEGRELYIGYGCPTEDPAFRVGTVYPGVEGNSFYSAFSMEQSGWKPMYVKNLGIYMDVALSATTLEKLDASSLTELGYAYIEPIEGRILKAGDRYPLKVYAPEGVVSVNWSLDGHVVSGESVELKAGTQKLRARLVYQDGREEVLELILKVN